MLGLEKGAVALLPHDPRWEAEGARICAELRGIIGSAAAEIRHIGSTAIRGISAKPIIDVAVAMKELSDAPGYFGVLADAGYIRDAAYDDTFRYYLYRADGKVRTHHIHLMQAGSREYADDVNFVDYLNENADAAREYEEKKNELAAKFAADRPSYTKGKKAVIEKLMRDAEIRRAGGVK